MSKAEIRVNLVAHIVTVADKDAILILKPVLLAKLTKPDRIYILRALRECLRKLSRWIKTGVREYTEYAEHAVKRGGRYYSGRLYGFIRLV